MTIFNKGGRNFGTAFGTLSPGKATPVPAEHEELAKQLISRYPNELLDGGSPDVGLRHIIAAKDAALEALRKELQVAKGHVSKLQSLLIAAGQKPEDLGAPEADPGEQPPAEEPAAPAPGVPVVTKPKPSRARA